MGLIPEEDDKRFFNQLALEGAASYLHPITGFIQDEGVTPLYENFLAASALFGSKQKDNMEKAQQFLAKLFPFQASTGLFPKYLHSYPQTLLEGYQCDIGLILKDLLSHFSSVMGAELTALAKQSLSSLLNALEHHRDQLSPHMRLQLEALCDHPVLFPPCKPSAHAFGQRLALAEVTAEYTHQLELLASYWHPKLQVYTGPLIQECYSHGAPELSLFDYFMSSYYRSYSKRLQERNLLQLQGAIVKYSQSAGVWKPSKQEGNYKGSSYLLINQDKAGWFCFTRHTSSFEESKGFHVLRCMFSSQGHLYHFVCHSKVQRVKAFFDTDTLEVEFTYAGALSDEIKEQNELCFYINKGPDLSVRVDGKKASLFHLDQTLDLLTQQALLRCSFNVESSHAEIVGHLSYGNRPSSVCDPDEGAFDHKIVLRTLRRSSDCVVRLKLQLIHMD